MYKYKKLKLAKNVTMDEHRFIMMRYIGRVLDIDESVHHRDENPRNNSLGNLELMSRKNHMKLHIGKGHPCPEYVKEKLSKLYRGEKGPSAKLTETSVLAIREALTQGQTLRTLGNQYGVAIRTILRIKQRDTWNHI